MKGLAEFNQAAAALGMNVWVEELEPQNYNRRYRLNSYGSFWDMSVSFESLAQSRDETMVMNALLKNRVPAEDLEKIPWAMMFLENSRNTKSASVELFGGPRDGEVFEIPVNEYGVPTHTRLVFASLPWVDWWNSTPTDVVSLAALEYLRVSLVPERKAWVYSLSGNNGV